MRFKILMLLILTIVLVIAKNIRPLSVKHPEYWRLECELEIPNNHECPVDGGWTPWSPWSVCRGSCDQIGHRVRTRECSNPPPSLGGNMCNGPHEQIESCFIKNCTAEDYRLLVEGDAPRSEALRQLEAVPALMERCLHMECPFDAIEAALAVDNTWQLNSESIWNALQCVKHNVGCPVVGEWGAWGKWSACGARCGQGFKWRLRRCDTPSPSEARYVCSGSPLDTKPCEGDQCTIERRDAKGTWAEWGRWTGCSESCGIGVKRRRRNCVESQKALVSSTWGTHCRGQHDQIELCKNKQCTLNGGWSGWSPWGPCSQSCGAGKRTRSRSCTRPIPAGAGTPCAGPKTEVGSCYLTPCNVNSHVVVLFNGNSYLQYRFKKQTSVLFHLYMRFMPLSRQGTLMYRGPMYSPYVHLSLRRGYVCLDAAGLDNSCNLKMCSHNRIETAVWHTIMITITAEAAEMRFDDAHFPVKAYFSCEPDLTDTEWDLIIGRQFYGKIQEVVVNFTPLTMIVPRVRSSIQRDHLPMHSMNIAYDMASLDEDIVYLKNQYIMRVPCFNEENEWLLELTLKPKRDSGTILFLGKVNQWLHVTLQNSRIKIKLAMGDYRSEAMSSTECPNDQWLDVTVRKTPEANSIEAIINGRERLHVLVGPEMERKRRQFQSIFSSINGEDPINLESDSELTLCDNEYFVGGVPPELKNNIAEEFAYFYGLVATISLDGIFYDLDDIGLERYKDNMLQVSSKTASVSDKYEETSWGKSNHLNLSCIQPGLSRSPNETHWLFLDTEIFNNQLAMNYARKDGRVLRLISSPRFEIRGFYTCRARNGRVTRNIVTYGVLGKATYKISEPDLPTLVAVVTSIILILTALGWLFGEGINDIRKGHGFFRDRHMSKDQVVKAICKYIDANQDLIGGSDAARISKGIARRRAMHAINRSANAAQERRGLNQRECLNEHIQLQVDLPALLENTSAASEPPQDLLRFEPDYVSTPQHGSISSPRKRLTSSSSVGCVSPRVLCSRVIDAKSRLSPREDIASKKVLCRKYRANMPWSSSLAKAILHKFHQLQKEA